MVSRSDGLGSRRGEAKRQTGGVKLEAAGGGAEKKSGRGAGDSGRGADWEKETSSGAPKSQSTRG